MAAPPIGSPQHFGRWAIRLFGIRSLSFVLVLAFIVLAALQDGSPDGLMARPPGDGLPAHGSMLTSSGKTAPFYPVGWFDRLQSRANLPEMRKSNMNIVLPYAGSKRDVATYLDHAHRNGLKVFVEIDRKMMFPPNRVGVRLFVDTHKKHPAVYGWFLADEPTLDDDYRSINPATAEVLYKEIKTADPARPVGMAFGVSEDPRPFLEAMDVMLYDDYVQGAQTSEFWGLGRWRTRLREHAAMAATLDGYMPILQAFGEDHRNKPQFNKRLPTAKEMRYITYTSIQYRATGVMFWSRYRSRKSWVDRVLTPLAREIAPARRAFAMGPARGVKVKASGAEASVFKDPASKALFLLLIHHGGGVVKTRISLDPALKLVRAKATGVAVDITRGVLLDELGPYAARLYRLS